MAEKKVDRTTNRPKRIPVSGNRDLITVQGKDPDFNYRIVKEKPGRVDKFQAAGYEMVTHAVEIGSTGERDTSLGTPVRINLGRGDTGYLMRQPKEYFDEDQAAKEMELRSREESLIQNKQDTYGKIEINRGSDPK